MSSKENFLEKTNEALTSIKSIDVKEATEYITIKKDAISFLNTLKNNIDSSDEYLIRSNMYDSIRQELDNIINLAYNFNNSNNNDYLNNIPNYIDNIIGNFSNIVMPSFNYDSNCIENNKNLESSYKELEEVLSNHKNKADEIDTQFNNINNNVDNLIKNTETRFDAFDDMKNECIQKKIIDKKNEEFDDAYKSQKEFIDNKQEEFDEAYESQKEFIDNTQKEYTEIIEGYHSDIKELVGLVTGDKISIASNKNAEQERIRAIAWSAGTVTAIFGSIGMFLVIFIKFLLPDDEISLIFILHKFTVNLPLLILAFYLISYCAKQSNHHLEKEAYYRDFAVKVKSIDLYTESLSKDKQEDLKYKVAHKLFMSSSSDKVKQDKQNQKSTKSTNDNNPTNEQQEESA